MKKNYKWFRFLFCTMLMVSCENSGQAGEGGKGGPTEYPKQVVDYNYIIGTQSIGAKYKFTDQSPLVETAQRIREMGSNIFKTSFKVADESLYNYRYEILKNNPDYKAVMAMDFKYYFFWLYSKKNGGFKDAPFTDQERIEEYDEMYKMAEYLLRNFKKTGKVFFLGNWEGDWHLTSMNGNAVTVHPDRIQRMIDWFNIRQKAVDDAIAANPNSDVKIYHYCEVNRVNDALVKGYERITNTVLPYIDVDYVSYSSYDATSKKDYASLKTELNSALNYIEQNMKPKPSISGRRVFIGEYGFEAAKNSEELRNSRAKFVLKAGIEWGCPFIMVWQMYDDPSSGHWLIDNLNAKKELYYTHEKFYTSMKEWVYLFNKNNNRLPTQLEFSAKAVEQL